MPEHCVNLMIGGAAGQGLSTVGQLLAKSLVRGGYEVLVRQDFMSRVRGGHNTFLIRAATFPLDAPREAVDLLMALNQESVDLHLGELAPGGAVFADAGLDRRGAPGRGVPFAELAPKPIFNNVAALGVLAGALGLDPAIPKALLGETFAKKGQAVVAQNHEVLDAAYAWVRGEKMPVDPLPPVADPPRRLMLTGNEALALGALAAGVNFCSYYPMTPGTSIAQTLVAHGRALGVVVEQAEDEIAAMNMGLGAAYAGARALVPTAGGGFALMTEAVSLAGVTETPIVCAVAQRPGPATGLATRTEQADLNLVLHAGHGEFPRAVFAPGTVEEFFHLTHRAFDLAERFQSPVFVLSDQYMANSYRSVAPFDLEALPEPAAPLRQWTGKEPYARYAVTDSGVSPRLLPGFTDQLVLADSHEHVESGHMSEAIEVRNTMQDKRLRKGAGLLAEAVAPTWDGPQAPELMLVCWGSTRGAALDAARDLRGQGRAVGVLHFSQVWPLNEEQYLGYFQAAGRVVCVEGNSTGQFEQLLRQQSCLRMDGHIRKYDGRTFTPEYILRALGALGLA
ncbi:2-oxoacid:acceptor oxidoreductase subunit alpha [Desulfocurvus vexinensis]|uniref:2-oxoacid:acceptor oxidoreductase subunit alpha n=1 Tax=Desulfocurvus vexinensis TaxID=399548 RepID=UPI00048FA0FE|nr:2-oxoacid:acceptor oxidoreductase subunit alpha [Desulfocurvus vexinensis]